MNTVSEEKKSPKKGINYPALIFVSVLVLGLTLPFHYVPQGLIAFPKDHLTLKYTFIFKSDLDSIAEKYNKSSIADKELLKSDPFIKKLFEKGLLINLTDSHRKQP